MTSNNDKDSANTVAQHYNLLGEMGLKERSKSRIFHQRNFNNWIKSIVIGDALKKIRMKKGMNYPISVLDLCSGKGGDLLKWKKGSINKLICADIAQISVEQSEVRYNDLKERTSREKYSKPLFDAEFIVADCTKDCLKNKFKDNRQTFDLASCQFSLHYSFESLQQAKTMIKNACESLEPGGYFIGTTLNSYSMIKRLKESGCRSFGNEVYKIEFEKNLENNKIPLFGARYHFFLEGVVNCPEFLVYFPVVQRLASEYQMSLVFCQSFDEFFRTHINASDNVDLLRKMMSLEMYPPEKDKMLSGSEGDYKHAKDYIANLSTSQCDSLQQSSKVGTLSLPEWEASSLYIVFMFQKNL